MKTGTRIGLAVLIGYVLGRFRKLKWVVALAAIIGRRFLADKQRGLLGQGSKLLESSPELGKLRDEIGGRLVEAAKSAAVTAASNRIDSLSDTLRERGEALRTSNMAGPDAADQESAAGERVPRQARRRAEGESETAEDATGKRKAPARSKARRSSQSEPSRAARAPAPRRGGGSADRKGAERPSRRGARTTSGTQSARSRARSSTTAGSRGGSR